MEYVVILLLIAIIAILWFKEPDRMRDVVIDSAIRKVSQNKDVIADEVFDSLPNEMRESFDGNLLHGAIEEILDFMIESIEEGIK